MKKSSSHAIKMRQQLVRKIANVPQEVWHIVVITTILKALLVATAVLASQLGFYCDDCRLTNGLWQPELPRTLLSAFQTWDAQQYLQIADTWYEPQVQRNAFYPLLPAVLAAARALTWPLEVAFASTHVFVVTAISMTTALSYAAVVSAFYAFRTLVQTRVAFWATVLLLSFPTAYTLHSIYTESLFILLVSGLIITLHKKMYWPAALCAFLLPLARPQGIVTVLGVITALALITYRVQRSKQAQSASQATETMPSRSSAAHELFVHTLWILVWACAGLALYYLNMIAFAGHVFAGVHAQQYFGSQFSFGYILHPLQWIDNTFFTETPRVFHFQHSSISQLLFGYSLIGLYFVARVQQTRPFWMLAFLLILVSAIPGTLTSYARYAFVLLPVYPAFVQWLWDIVRNPRVRTAILGSWIFIGIIAQCVLYFYHSSNNWIA